MSEQLANFQNLIHKTMQEYGFDKKPTELYSDFEHQLIHANDTLLEWVRFDELDSLLPMVNKN